MTKLHPQCPRCGEELEVIDVAPCDDCGWNAVEIEHFKNREHTYSEFEVYGSKLVLCNFCDVDFSSYDPEVWGFQKNCSVGYGTRGFNKITELPYSLMSIKKEQFCPNCRAKLSMIEAQIYAKENNSL